MNTSLVTPISDMLKYVLIFCKIQVLFSVKCKELKDLSN
jgi:hypothetical protein